MIGRQHKKLNLLIEFSKSIFIKYYFKAYCKLFKALLLGSPPLCWFFLNFNDKILQKIQKTYFGDIFGSFFPNLVKNELSLKNGLSQFLNIPIIYNHAKNQSQIS